MRRLTTGLLFVVICACGRGDAPLGAGTEFDVCAGYAAYEALPEPDPSDPDDVRRVADGFVRVFGRIDTERTYEDDDGDRETPGPEIVRVVEALGRRFERFRDDVRAAGDDEAEVAAAVRRLSADDELKALDDRFTTFAADCDG